MSALPRVCIIGAGSSGVATAKALKERGIPYDCFEKSDDVGGNWYYNNPNGVSSAYRMLHIDTSKVRMQYPDFPMPAEWPNFCHHSQVFQYFRDYADHFGLRETITFRTAVQRAQRADDGTWQIDLSTGEQRQYDALFVCNGHHWDPRWPEPPFPGQFAGRVLHSHNYRDAEQFRGQRVLVLGMGNSAMDIAVECSYVAAKVYLAARRGAYIIPKYLWGRPIDQWNNPWLPWRVQRVILRFMLGVQVGKMQDYGLQPPDHDLFEAHPSVSSTILDRIAHGDIVPKPNIDRFDDHQVRFVDGTTAEVDAVIYCTGYKVSFPFFDAQFLAAPGNDLPLFLRVFKPGLPNLFFIGLLQPLGAIFPLAALQAGLASDYLLGRYALPSVGAMQEQMQGERQRMFTRYVRSPRHTMQVDFDTYVRQLARERKRGARRAAEQGNCLPVPPRAASTPAPAAVTAH
ncbi:MAG: NAD(P)-binding domain-containing protein [Pirellulales bacterium]|nr:NAD(P)-binding domain-containing protein [Pirellulales bacterium]